MEPFFDRAGAQLTPRDGQPRGSALRATGCARCAWLAPASPRCRRTSSPACSRRSAKPTGCWMSTIELRAQRVQARVMPLGLAQQGTRLYLVCRFEATTTSAQWRSTACCPPRRRPSASSGRPRSTSRRTRRLAASASAAVARSSSCSASARPPACTLESPLSADQRYEERQDAYEITDGHANRVAQVVAARLRARGHRARARQLAQGALTRTTDVRRGAAVSNPSTT